MSEEDLIKLFGSKQRELDRTAEMVVDLANRGNIHLAIWLIVDSNRFDVASMNFLAARVQEHWKLSHEKTQN